MPSYLRGLQHRLRGRLDELFLNVNPFTSNVVILAGKGRSGTTWMANIINYAHDYRCLFEPFHPGKVDMCQHFGAKKYLRPTVTDPQYALPITRILRGRVRSSWVDSSYMEQRGYLFRKRLIKTIRATLFLRWIHVHFPDIPIVIALRHPCAVIASILRQGWSPMLTTLMGQEQLLTDHLEPFASLIAQVQDDFEAHVFSWCIEYYIVFQQFEANEIHLLFYENLWEEPESEVASLFGFIGQDYDEERVLKVLRVPSTTTSLESRKMLVSDSGILSKWRKQLSRSQVKRCVEILEIFGLDKIYTDALYPSLSGALNVIQQKDKART
jgi:hypothetical protein